MIRQLLSVVILFPIVGCVHEPRSVEVAKSSQRSDLTAEESDRCKEVAWEAVNSEAMLQRFKPERMTTQPFQFSKTGITCYPDKDDSDKVNVAVPSGHDVLHGCYMEVKVKRSTHEVVGMRERFWP